MKFLFLSPKATASGMQDGLNVFDNHLDRNKYLFLSLFDLLKRVALQPESVVIFMERPTLHLYRTQT